MSLLPAVSESISHGVSTFFYVMKRASILPDELYRQNVTANRVLPVTWLIVIWLKLLDAFVNPQKTVILCVNLTNKIICKTFYLQSVDSHRIRTHKKRE